MKTHDYVILEIGKVIIINEENKKTFLIEEEGKQRPLTESEQQYVENIFKRKKGYIYEDEYIIGALVDSNDSLVEKEEWTKFLSGIELSIPEGSKGNYYKNIQTFSLEFIDKLTDLSPEISKAAVGAYNSEKNKIILGKDHVADMIKNKYDIVAESTLVHELCHMASSRYDEEAKRVMSGFDVYPALSPKDQNVGLTEGLTENLAMSITGFWHPELSGYFQDVMIASQLSQIIGKDIVLKSYFENRGIEPLENALNEIIDDKEKSSMLFRQIEDAHTLSSFDVPQTSLGNAQSTLVDYFIKKTKKNMIDDFEGTYASAEVFENCLIKPEVIEKRGGHPDNYIGLPESIEEFTSFKDKMTTLREKLSEIPQQVAENQAIEPEAIPNKSM